MSVETRNRLQFATLDEIATAARDALDPAVWDFMDGGAGTERTLRANCAAFGRWSFRPRLMSGIGMPELSTSFMGFALAMPVLTGPVGAEGKFHPDGYLAIARANAVAGVQSIVPEAARYSLEAVAEQAPGAAGIMQLHPTGKVEHVLAIVARAAAAGYEALCVTCDCPTAGWRERNLRNRFVVDIEDLAGNFPPGSPVSPQEVFGQLFDRDEPLWTWDQLAEAMAAAGMPWMAKGILTGHDALAAAEAGAAAVVVSNHGGRQLDGAPAALDQLPEVVGALAGSDVQVALDSGVRRGSDVVTALALGADAVIIGRLVAYGLAADGQAGVERVHHLLRDEIDRIMTLTGRPTIADIDRDLVQPAP